MTKFPKSLLIDKTNEGQKKFYSYFRTKELVKQDIDEALKGIPYVRF